MTTSPPQLTRLRILVAYFLSLVTLLVSNAQETDLQEEAQSQDALNAARMQTVFENVDELRDIKVTVANGVVRLEGEATSEEDRSKAESVAKGLPDVIYVDNDIQIASAIAERLSPSVTRLHKLADQTKTLIPLLGIAVGVLFVAWLMARLAAWAFRASPLSNQNRLLRGILENVLKVAVFLIGLYIALEILGATAVVGAVLGAAGVAGLAISFAFRDIIENFLASVLLSLRQPFQIKDVVDINGTMGKVVRLTSSETVLMTLEGNHVRLPNAAVFKGEVINYTRNPERRFAVVVGVGTDEDLIRAEEVGLRTLSEMPGVLSEPPPKCVVDELGDSNVALRFLGWVDQSQTDFEKVRSHATRLIKVVFDSEEIGMPNPIYDVNIRRPKTPSQSEVNRQRDAQRKSKELAREASSADVAPDSHIDRQIDEEKLAGDDEDLLSIAHTP